MVSLQMRLITTTHVGNVAFAVNSTKYTINHRKFITLLFARDVGLIKFIFFYKRFVKLPHGIRSAFVTIWSGSFLAVKFLCSFVLQHFCLHVKAMFVHNANLSLLTFIKFVDMSFRKVCNAK